MKQITTKRAPVAIGPYSQGVLVRGVLYCSGQIPIVPETGELILNDMALATKQVLLNLEAIVQAAGLTKNNIVNKRFFILDTIWIV